MLRNGRTGHTWHLVLDYNMLVMKMRSSSPANRPVKRIYVHVQKKKWLFTAGAVSSDWRKPAVIVNVKKKKKKMCFYIYMLRRHSHY